MIWALIAIMGAATVLGLIWPLGRSADDTGSRAGKAMAIYEDQLSEVERDAERGLITAEEARAAQVEIKRRMLAIGNAEDTPRDRRGKVAIFAAALAVPLAAFGLYTQVGSPGVLSVPFAEREGEQENARQLQTLITELRGRLNDDPDGGDIRGWELLGSTLMNQGRPGEAAEAFERATTRPGATSATWSQYAESLIAAESGVVTPRALQAIETAAELDPSNPAATFYRALADEQEGNPAGARQRLLERVAQEERPQPWIPTFVQTANQMGERLGLEPVELPVFADAPPGPSAAEMAAAADMSPEERQEFIRSMVDGLEARLQEEPEDLDGWLQLARALVVMGEQSRAYGALQEAEKLVQDLPDDDSRKRLVVEGLRRFAPE